MSESLQLLQQTEAHFCLTIYLWRENIKKTMQHPCDEAMTQPFRRPECRRQQSIAEADRAPERFHQAAVFRVQTNRASAVFHIHPFHALICIRRDAAVLGLFCDVHGVIAWWKFTQVRKLMARRLEPGWNFSTLYLIKDSLAIMLEAAGLLEDAFREYFELEACYLEALKQGGNLAGRQFGEPFCIIFACRVQSVLHRSHGSPV